ncbi:hypothetical protein WJX79_008144 [Trebouxia sp. C0005]
MMVKPSNFLIVAGLPRGSRQIETATWQLHHPPKAFSALSEAVKYKRDSWQTWSNYGQAAAQTGTGLPAARAVRKM